MPLYEFKCPSCQRCEEHFFSIDKRNTPVLCHNEAPFHPHVMRRLMGGHGMLYFEEGRARTQLSLSDKPITSYAQHRKYMKASGLVEAGDTVIPPRMKAKNGPKRKDFEELSSKKAGQRWL